ncbi:choice-of-anchor M domain-containing protein [Streptomyces sp. NPDC048659]|uniref:choice-of-anchor M domain-containing protein n=1 Tax=Streptomyces sp. NPDC048659 TaxID=3155489 RepID=UPI00342BEE20
MRAPLVSRPALTAAVAAAVLLPLAAPPPALAADPPTTEAPAGQRTVLSGGHLDLAARLRDGRLDFMIKDGTVPGRTVWRQPSDVVLHFDPRHALVVPPREEVPQFEGLGEPGRRLWVDKDFASVDGLLWPGWSTMEILPAAVAGTVEVSFPRIVGPGRLVLGQWADDPELGVRVGILVDGAKPDPGRVALRPYSHSHPLWILDTEGVYRVTLEMTATLPSGAKVSDRETLAVAVGDLDASTVVPGEGAGDGDGGGPGESPRPTEPGGGPSPSPTPMPTSTSTGSPTPTRTTTPSPTQDPDPDPTGVPTGTPSPSASGSGPGPSPQPTRTPSQAGPGPGPGRLAATGAGLALPAGIAGAALLAGGALVVLVRRKKGAR